MFIWTVEPRVEWQVLVPETIRFIHNYITPLVDEALQVARKDTNEQHECAVAITKENVNLTTLTPNTQIGSGIYSIHSAILPSSCVHVYEHGSNTDEYSNDSHYRIVRYLRVLCP